MEKLFSFEYRPGQDAFINVKAKSLTEAVEKVKKVRTMAKKLKVSFCDESDDDIFIGYPFPGERSFYIQFACPSCDCDWTWVVLSDMNEKDPCFHKCEECGEYFHLLTPEDVGTFFKRSCKKCDHRVDCLSVQRL